MTELIIIALVLTYLVWSFFQESSLPKKFRYRNCMGRRWKSEFPEHPASAIRSFLDFFVDAFAFDRKDRLQFEPSDKLLEIYHELYPYKWQADALEFETLAEDLNKKYGIEFEGIWHDDLTLGELYSALSKK